MNKETARKPAFGMIGLFSAMLLVGFGEQTTAHADTQTATTVTSAQPAAAAKVAEAAIALTNQHANLNMKTTDDHEMGDGLNAQALIAATDESKSTSSEHVMQAPAGLSEAQSSEWLRLVKAEAVSDQKATGRAQKIIMVAATANTIKSFAIGATDVPDVDAVDVASYQSWMSQANYDTLKQKGVKSAIVKVSEGSTYMNPYAQTSITRAKKAGLQVGVYHYARFNSTATATAEAKKVISSLQALGLAKTTRIFADMEDNDTAVASVATNLEQFWATLSASGYNNHAVYTGGGQGTAYASGVANTVGAINTWYAAYPYTPTADSTLASFKGLNYGAWQFSSAAYIAGTAGNTIDVSDDYSGVLTNLGGSTVAQPAQGPWLAKSGYIKVKSDNYDFWKSFNFTSSVDSADYNGQELVVNGMYHHQNGSTYYSVYTKAGAWVGYLNAVAATWEGEQGQKYVDDRNVTITGNYSIYSDFDWNVRHPAGSLIGKTYHSTGKYLHLNGNTYLSLYDTDGTWIGYINQAAVKVAAAQGPWLSKSGYIKVTSGNYDFWKSFDFAASVSSAQYKGQELVVNGMYHHANGSTYYSVYTKAGAWIGYLNAKAANWEGGQGAWHQDDRYVTITHNYDVYSNFDFKKAYAAGTLTGNTYHSTGKYAHINGNTYLSLYRADGSWVGYINQNAVTVTDKNGAHMAKTGYITFDESGKTAYNDLAHSSVRNTAKVMAGHTYKVTGEYRAYSGTIQYSVYTLDGKWLGYVDAAGSSLTTNQQGQWVARTGYFTTTVKGQTIWSGFDYHGGKSTSTYYQNTYKINGEYFHSNGSKYYSLYDNQNQWMGYINAANGVSTNNAGGAWISINQTVKIAKAGYPIWHGFFTDQVGGTASILNQTYRATGKYHHFNGSWYDSLYSGKTWIGYVNAVAVKVQ